MTYAIEYRRETTRTLATMEAENDLQAVRLLLQRLTDTPPHAEVLRVTMRRNDAGHETGVADRIVAFLARPIGGWS